MLRRAIVLFLLGLGAAFVGFQGIPPWFPELVALALFVLFTLLGLVCLNAVLLRRPAEPPDSPDADQ